MELFSETGVFALDCGGWSMRHLRDEMAGLAMTMAPRAGEMRARVRDFDWATTSVGPAEDVARAEGWIAFLGECGH
jgi:hypothetical protein